MDSYKLSRAREQQWQELVHSYIQEAEEQGWSYEPEIVETIVVLRLFGITIYKASMGISELFAYPWVSIKRAGLNEEEQLVRLAWEEAQKQRELKQLPRDQIDGLFYKYHRMKDALISKHLEERGILLQHLTAFYAKHQVPYDRVLTLQDMQYTATLESQGAQFQILASPQERQEKLLEYQQEMQQFTEFLKHAYFSAP